MTLNERYQIQKTMCVFPYLNLELPVHSYKKYIIPRHSESDLLTDIQHHFLKTINQISSHLHKKQRNNIAWDTDNLG